MCCFHCRITNAVLPSRTKSTYKAFKMTKEMNFGDIEKTKGSDLMISFCTEKVIKISLYFTFKVKTYENKMIF